MIDTAARHDGHHRGRCQAVALDDRHQLPAVGTVARHHVPAVDRHGGTARRGTGAARPSRLSMIGTTETTGTTAAVAIRGPG
jgi:hypothetical protein